MSEPVTMEDWDADPERAPEERLFWPAWTWPLLAWLPLDGWHTRLAREMPVVEATALARAHLTQGSLAWLATAAVAALALAEAAFYGMLWAARGRRLPVLASAVAVLQCGAIELLALDVLARAHDGWRVAAALLAGPRALQPPGEAAGALAVAFGGAGLLSLARCALFAALQSRLVPCRWREAFALTCGVWLASHLLQGWLLGLLEGRSLHP